MVHTTRPHRAYQRKPQCNAGQQKRSTYLPPPFQPQGVPLFVSHNTFGHPPTLLGALIHHEANPQLQVRPMELGWQRRELSFPGNRAPRRPVQRIIVR